jgi:hypothetical protein
MKKVFVLFLVCGVTGVKCCWAGDEKEAKK